MKGLFESVSSKDSVITNNKAKLLTNIYDSEVK